MITLKRLVAIVLSLCSSRASMPAAAVRLPNGCLHFPFSDHGGLISVVDKIGGVVVDL